MGPFTLTHVFCMVCISFLCILPFVFVTVIYALLVWRGAHVGTVVYHARAQTADCCGVGGYNATELALNLVVDTILHAVSCVSWRNISRYSYESL